MDAPAIWFLVRYRLTDIHAYRRRGKTRVQAYDATHATVIAYNRLRRGTNAAVEITGTKLLEEGTRDDG